MKSATAPAPDTARLSPVPSSCYLCGGARLSLRFPERRASGGPETYRCTSFGHRCHPPIWACQECGLLFQWPMRDADELRSAYEEVEDPLYMAEREDRLHTFRRVLGAVGPARGRRLLDVGAYCGYFLEVAQAAGFRAEGLELSRWAAAQAQASGLVVHRETLVEAAGSGRRYDVVTLFDVVEHLPDPRADLAAAFRLLEPGGRIHVSTIDAASLLARLLGARWPWLMEMHLIYFDRSTLPALLEEVGFREMQRRPYVHTVSADYLLRKIAASFPLLAPAASLLRRLVPPRWPIPVNLGDNMLVTAVKP